METIRDISKILESKTLDEIEAEILELVELKEELKKQDYMVVDILCLECFFQENFIIENELEVENYFCPNCNTDNIRKIYN